MEKFRRETFSVTNRFGIASGEDTTSTMSKDSEEQMADGDDLLKCFSSLFNSMRLFGFYFTKPASNRVDVERKLEGATKKWNGVRIYATVILALMWFYAIRCLSVFDDSDKFGLRLLLKLAMVSGAFISAVMPSALYLGCHTGRLDQVFRQAKLMKSHLAKYRRLAIIHTAVCFSAIATGMILFVLPLFLSTDNLDISLTPFTVHISVSVSELLMLRIASGIFYTYAVSSWVLSLSVNYIEYFKVLQCTGSSFKNCPHFQSVNYIVTSVLYDQFKALNNDFHQAVGRAGEFRGSIREFRRRHLELCQSVQNADKFMMISNVAGFGCQLINMILVLYCAIFFREETVGQDVMSALLYVFWLSTSLSCLTVTACQGIVINLMAHGLTEDIHEIDLLSLDAQSVSEIYMFLDRLHGNPIGFSVLGIFVVERHTILTVLGLLVTYFLLVVQFGIPFESQAATSGVLTSNTSSVTVLVP